MQFFLTNSKGRMNVTQLVATWKWSGDKRQAVRTIQMQVLSSPSDKHIPVVDWATGGTVEMLQDGEELFYGKVLKRSKSTGSSTIDLTCHDNARHLVRNSFMRKYTSKTPEEITSQLVNELNQELGLTLEIGSIAETNIAISRLFLSGNDSAYDIILTCYTLAAKTTGEKYHIGFRGRKLFVTAMQPTNRTLVIRGKSNLIGAHVTESIENLVTQVQIYDTQDKFVRSINDGIREKLYDPIRKIVKQTASDDRATYAQKLLDSGGLDQKITLDNIGNIACVSGGTVVVEEPYTGLYGLFYIDADIHEWKRQQYYNKLTLNLKNIMDEKEVGTLPNVDGFKTTITAKQTTSSSKNTKKGFHWDEEKEIQWPLGGD